jgi:galactonate dehydratase
MRITDMETFLVAPRWLFLRIGTDEGVVGWGEPVVEGRAETVRAAVEELSEYLIGRDPLPLEDHWQVLTKGGFYRGGPVLSSAVAGIDQALWDIAGKVRGAPVHELLGGPVRDRIRVYAAAHGPTLKAVVDTAAELVDAGYTALKITPIGRLGFLDTPSAVDDAVRRAEAVREVLGPGRDLAMDFHGRVSLAMARRILPRMEPFLPLFVEEPVLPEFSDRLGRITAHTSIPIATGERLYSRREFKTVLDAGIAVAQPDASHAGGISEVRRIAALAEMYDVQIAPHCPLGPISLAACLQIGFATPNYLIQEQSLDLHRHRNQPGLDYLLDTSVLTLADGHIARPVAPGLGLDIDERAVRSAAERAHRFRSPVWRHCDGSFAEW